MFGFGFKKKWKSNKESKEDKQPQTVNGIKLLTFRAIDNEFAPKAPAPQYHVQRQPRTKRNVMEVFRQSYPNFASQRNDTTKKDSVQFETVQPRHDPVSNQSNNNNFSAENNEKSTLIFMTENHDEIVHKRLSENEPANEDIEINLGAAFAQRRMQLDETVPSVEQEQELEDIYATRKASEHEQDTFENRSSSDKDSFGERETVDLYNATSELGEDNFKVHVVQHANDAMSMVSYQSGDTLLDSVSVLDDKPKFRFDHYYNFGESQTEEMGQTKEAQQQPESSDSHTYETEEHFSPLQLNINNNTELEEQLFEIDERVQNIIAEQTNKRVMFDVSDNEEKQLEEEVKKRVMFDVRSDDDETHNPKFKSEILTTPQRKETLEDVKMKTGYSMQASALFFNGADDDGNDSETSA